MTNLNTAARAYALSLDAQCPPSPTESFEAGWEAAQGEIERLQGEYNAYRADGEPELRAANAEIMRLLAKLDSIRARCLNLAQWIDKGCDPKHGATEASFIALFAKEPSDEPNSCASPVQCPIEYTGVSGAYVQCKLPEGHQGCHDFMPQPPPSRT